MSESSEVTERSLSVPAQEPSSVGNSANSTSGASSLRSVDSLRAEIERFAGGLDVRPVQGRLQISGDSLICSDGRRVRVDENGLKGLCRQLRIPAAYVAGLDAEIRSDLLQYHFDRGDHTRSNGRAFHPAIMSRDGRFIGFGRSDLTHLSPVETTTIILESLGEQVSDLEVNGLNLADDGCTFEIVCPTVAREVSAGDVIQGGIHVAYSPVGQSATRIETFILRLICRSGMTHRQCVEQTSITRTRRLPSDHPDGREIHMQQLRELTRSVWDGLQGHLQCVSDLKNEQVTDLEEFLGQFLRRARLWSRSTLRLLQEAIEAEGGEPTAYTAFNALTRVATHSADLSGRQRQSLSALGGLLAHRSTHICPSCYSVLAN